MTLTQSWPMLTVARRVHILVSKAFRARGKPQAGQVDWDWGRGGSPNENQGCCHKKGQWMPDS